MTQSFLFDSDKLPNINKGIKEFKPSNPQKFYTQINNHRKGEKSMYRLLVKSEDEEEINELIKLITSYF